MKKKEVSSVVRSEQTRGNWHKTKYRKFNLNIRQNIFFYWEDSQTLAQAAQEFVETLSLLLDTQLQVPQLEQGSWTRWSAEVPSILNHSVIL